jgi:hypothetical protein
VHQTVGEVSTAGHRMLLELDAMVHAIAERPLGEETRPAELGQPAVPDEVLDQLEALLEAADYEAVALFRQHAGSLQAQFGATAEELGTRLRGFDYERALALLRSLRSSADT